jgi:integrase/recombinase XerD
VFAKCDAEERLWYQFFLMTGMREQEVMYTYWSDINLAASTVRVSHKPDRGWTPKAYKKREIPIPTKLVKSLKAWIRATFATWSLWAGVDLRTVQQWLGHSDMESTMRYLKPSRSQHVRDKVNDIFA